MVWIMFGYLNLLCLCFFFFFKQKTAYEMRISDWSSDVCSSDLHLGRGPCRHGQADRRRGAGADRGTDALRRQAGADGAAAAERRAGEKDRKSTRLNSSH